MTIGGLCGAIFVDEAFKEVLKKKFDKRWEKMEESSRRDLVFKEWEMHIKRKFSQNSKKGYELRIPFECLLAKEKRAAGSSVPKIEITPEDVKEAFDPVIDAIIHLIGGQVKSVKEKEGVNPKVKQNHTDFIPVEFIADPKMIQYIIMVGGFGRCKYLFDRVDQKFSSEIEVLQSKETKP